MYSFITDIFYVHSFLIKLAIPLKNVYLWEIGLLICLTAAKVNKK